MFSEFGSDSHVDKMLRVRITPENRHANLPPRVRSAYPRYLEALPPYVAQGIALNR